MPQKSSDRRKAKKKSSRKLAQWRETKQKKQPEQKSS